MKVEEVWVSNWEPFGDPKAYWKAREAAPDEPESIDATIRVKMSYAEYRRLLDEDMKEQCGRLEDEGFQWEEHDRP